MDATSNRVQHHEHDFFPDATTARSKSIHHRGDFMNGSQGIGRRRILTSMAMVFGAIFTIMLLPAYGQQDVDPTWYNPWAASNATVSHQAQPAAAAHSSQLPIAAHRYQQLVKAGSAAAGAQNFRLKDIRLDQSSHNAGHKSSRASSKGLVSVASRDSLTPKPVESE